jgi:hypothetical protein
MPTRPRKQPDDIQIAMEILKEAAEPRLSASVKEPFEKENPALSPRKGLVGKRRENQSPLEVCRLRRYCTTVLLGRTN